MINIAICEDETQTSAELERTLIDILGKLQVKYEIGVFFSGEGLCKAIESGTHYDLIFLDIEYPKSEINGVDIGRRIRDIHNNHMAAIVYISWAKNYALELFDIQPFNFLIKPLKYEKIEEVIRKYVKISGLWSEEFTYKTGHDTLKVQIKDIVYLENNGKKLRLYLANGNKEEFYGSIKMAYQEQLKRFDFLFIHTSYIVNYDYIATLKINEVFLAYDAPPLPISKHRKNEIRAQYFEIMKRRRA